MYTQTSFQARTCYFSSEFQGHYVVQAQASPGFGGRYVRYSDVTVEINSITPWGRCEQRYQKNVILSEKWRKCMRCFHLTFKTPNVIQIHTEGFTTCHSNMETALATCPDEELIFKGGYTEIMMYRKKDPRNAFTVQNVFCPINGKFRFTFHGNNGNYRCDEPYPELSNCPHGNTLEFRFHQCTFPDTSKSFLCLGDWQGPNNERYVALMDLSEGLDTKPRFRCGLYRRDPSTGRGYLSLSEDSTCVSGLESSSNGYETFSLTPLPSRSLPAPVLTTMCEFPSWFQGRWENLEVSGNKFVYEDHRKLQAITAWCVTMETNTPFELFHIYTVTQCGDEAYNCVWLQQRTENIVELQLGVSSSSEYIPSFCRNHRFEPHTWVTLGRIDVTESESCPISGTYIGAASGGERLCAKLATDCDSPDILFYSIRGCKDKPYSYGASSGSVNHQSQSFYGDLQEHEPIEREYRCLGNWEENGISYTYVQRRDVPGFQCLSGKLTRNGAEVSITDTGQSCLREDGPHSYGINFIRNTTCSRNPLASDFSTRPFWRPYGIPSSEQSLTVSPSLIPNTWVWNPSNLNHPTQPNIQDSPYERSRSYVTQRHHNDLLYKSQPTRPPWRPTYVNNPPDADPVNRPQPSRPPWKPTYINNPPHADPAYGPQPSSPPWRPTYINNPPHADPAYGPRPSRPPWRPTYLNNPPHADPSYGPQPSRPPWRPTYVNNPPDADPANRPQPSSPPWRSTYLNNPPHADPAYGPQPSGPPWRPPYLNNPPHADPAYRPQPTRPPWRPTYINNPPDTDPVYRPQPSRPPLRPTYVNNPPHTDPANRPQPSRLPWRPSRVTQPSGKEDPIQQTRQHWKPSLVRHPEPSDRRPPNNQWTKNSYQYPGGPFRFTTPSWRPITGRPRSERNNESVSLVSASHLLRTLCVIYLVIFGRHVDLL